MTLNVWKLYLKSKKKIRKTRLINYYDNRIDSNTTYLEELDSNKRTIKDVN